MQSICRHACALFSAIGLLTAHTPARAQVDETAAAVQALVEFKDACQRVKPLWSVELCGPMVLVNPNTRAAVANQADPAKKFSARDGMFVGQWPAEMDIANTSMDWGGKQWAVVMLPLSPDTFTRLQLLAHESFHRIQPALGFELGDPMAQHLDEEEGRVLLRLELRAYARALRSEGEEARTAALDGLMFRRARYAIFQNAGGVERKLESHEGLAEYTGMRFALDATKASWEDIAKRVEAFEKRRTYVRSLGYGTGPAMGLLLDRYQPGWRQGAKSAPEVSTLLAAALKAPAADPARDRELAATRSVAYGSETIRPEEAERAARLSAERKQYMQTLVTGPVLVLELPEKRLMFNPNTVLSMGEEGNVYPKSILIGPWGRLTLQEGGALATADRGRARVAAPSSDVIKAASGGTVNGPGWTLELQSGWRIVPGIRTGDFTLSEAAK